MERTRLKEYRERLDAMLKIAEAAYEGQADPNLVTIHLVRIMSDLVSELNRMHYSLEALERRTAPFG